VSDGNFPNEFSTGRPELVEEERRLLYVAMTRAKTDLHLISPMKYYVTGQSRMGDRHVYGAKSRFMTPAVMACLQETSWGQALEGGKAAASNAPRIDIAAQLRGMWSA
jgi:DNA helicase-2/ATP-dependent DNA helicase PcrA